MPLQDHFHGPWDEEHWWEGFYSAWINSMVRYLNGSVLPRNYRALPMTHVGSHIEANVATFEQEKRVASDEGEAGMGAATALWSPPEPSQTLVMDLRDIDSYEVRVYDQQRQARLAAAVDLISSSNKDRPEHRKLFNTKYASYLQQEVNLVLVDIVTYREGNLHEELLNFLEDDASAGQTTELYANSYRCAKENSHVRVRIWPFGLTLGEPLPRIPLWLSTDLSVPLDLEKTYSDTCTALRIA